MSLVRVGLSENKKFANGYDAIFAAKPAKKTAVRKKAAKKARRK